MDKNNDLGARKIFLWTIFIATVSLLFVWLLVYRQLPFLIDIYQEFGANYPFFISALENIGLFAPVGIVIVAACVFYLVWNFRKFSGLISVCWVVLAFWFNYLVIQFHSQAWLLIS